MILVGTVEAALQSLTGMMVDVTQPGTYGLQAKVEVLLDKPLADLISFTGKELQFDILGHDILGKPVCEAYLNGININEGILSIMNFEIAESLECSLGQRKNKAKVFKKSCCLLSTYFALVPALIGLLSSRI